MKHDTPLSYHFRDTHFWWDALLVAMLWSLLFFLPQEIFSYATGELLTIIKIVALIASLEMVAFFSFHMMKRGHGVIIQGGLGGLISSTTVFVKLTRQKAQGSSHHITLALLSATIAMLLECVLIIVNFVSASEYKILIPILIQLFLISLYMIYLSLKSRKIDLSVAQDESFVDDPVIWKKVLKLASFIIVLVWGIRLVNHFATFKPDLTIFIMSLFEAHSVLTASLITRQSDQSTLLNVLLILTGHTLSKSYLVLTSKNGKKTYDVIIVLVVCLAVSWGAFFLIE